MKMHPDKQIAVRNGTRASYQERILQVLLYIQRHLDSPLSLEDLAEVACVTVGEDVQPAGEIGVQEIPAGDFAVYLHKGPFEKLIDTYGALCGGWLPESGREIKDQPSVEIYLNDPNTTAPEDLLVEIQIPLE